MDQWNQFKSPSSADNPLVDFAQIFASSSNSSNANNRYGSLNGHTNGSQRMNPFNSTSPNSTPTPSLNSAMNISPPNMHHHHHSYSACNGTTAGGGGYNSSSSTSSLNSMNSYGSSSHSNGPPASYGSGNNSSMPSQSQSGSAASGQSSMGSLVYGYYKNAAAAATASASRNRYSYYEPPSPSGPPPNSSMVPPRTPTSGFPPPPPSTAGMNSSGGAHNSYYNSNGTSSNSMYGSNGSNGSGMYHQQQSSSMPARPMMHQHHSMHTSSSSHHSAHHQVAPPQHHGSNSNYFDAAAIAGSSNNAGGAFPPIGDFKIDTFTMNSSGQVTETGGMDGSRTYPGSTSNGPGNVSGPTDASQNVRETGIIEKLLQTYGFIQCCERQARLFFHFSQFEGNTDHLRIGDPVEFEVTFDRRTGKPIASSVQKISPEVSLAAQVLSEERVIGAVTTELLSETGGEQQGRISYENRGECFFLPYGKDDVEGYVTLKPGDKVSFQIATNQRTGNLAARHVRLEDPVAPVRYQGVVSALKEDHGFIERADVVDEIFFHQSETEHIHGGLKLGDDVEFRIAMKDGKEVAMELKKLQDGSVVFEDTSQDVVRGQVLKTVERNPQHNAMEPLPGRIRYRGEDRSEVEVKFGERDQRGNFTLRHGDWVEFNIATDRRDGLQKATNITLLDESFTVSGERREQGIVQLLKKQCGYILCCDRDLHLHFHYRELLDPNKPVSVGDELEFTIGQDPTLSGQNKHTATRISHKPKGTAQFELPVQGDLTGQVLVLAEPAPPFYAPEHPGSFVSAKGKNGTISYLVDGQKHTMDYIYTPELATLKHNDKVSFSVFFNKRFKTLLATEVRPYIAEASNSVTSSTASAAVNTESDQPQGTSTTVAATVNGTSVETSSTVTASSTASNSVTTTTVSAVPTTTSANNNTSSSTFTTAVVPTANGTKKGSQKGKANKQVYQGYVAALKESFGFIETCNHDKEIFFHFSNVTGSDGSEVAAKLELGDEVEYTLSSRTGPGGKISAENINLLPKGTLPKPKVFETIYNGLVIRPIRSSNPDQPEYCGLLAIDTDDVERSEQYQFGITGVVNKRELLQKYDSVTFQVDENGWASNIIAVRKKLIATVDTVKGQYGFLNYEAEEGKKLFFHQTEVKDKASLSPGDEVEFVIITNQKTGKSSACSIARIMPAGGQSKRPQRLISKLKTMSLDQSKPRIIVLRQPKGPDNSKGFSFIRCESPTLVE